MQRRFPHPSAAERDHPAGTGLRMSSPTDSDIAGLTATLAAADRACCCLARPMVMVVLPPTPRRTHAVDLLLCGHHYHASKDALSAAGAIVYDSRELLIETEREPADSVSAH